jgi:hypothetical protein
MMWILICLLMLTRQVITARYGNGNPDTWIELTSQSLNIECPPENHIVTWFDRGWSISFLRRACTASPMCAGFVLYGATTTHCQAPVQEPKEMRASLRRYHSSGRHICFNQIYRRLSAFHMMSK